MEEIARWVDGQGRDWLGVELIAFTHDEDYWERLNRLLPTLTCPLTFHGPYIGVEAVITVVILSLPAMKRAMEQPGYAVKSERRPWA